MKRRSVTFSHCGPVRELNADAVFADDAAGFYAVADGVGSEPSSAQAGAAAIRLAWQLMKERGGDCDTARLVEQSHEAYVRTFANADIMPATTLTLLMIAGHKVRHASVGDSPLFLIEGSEVTLLTREHSLVDQDIYYDDYSEMKAQEGAHILTNHFGRRQLQAVTYPTFEVRKPCRIVLCTDGVFEFITQAGLGALSAAAVVPGEMVEGIETAAKAGIAADNYSGVIVDLTP